MARTGVSAAVIFHILDDGSEVITFPRLNWALVLATAILIVGVAIAIMVLVSSAEFDDTPPAVPSSPVVCEPFCPPPS
ncbi:hypothetical protein [Nocardia sp. IFM 10818]